MRRIQIAWAILACITLLAIGSHVIVWRVTHTTTAQLEQLRASAQMQNYSAARQQAEEVVRYFSGRQHLLEFFMRREAVAQAAIELHGLAAYANKENAPDLFSEIDKAQEQLRMLEHLFFSLF
jgi:hypothetical protein